MAEIPKYDSPRVGVRSSGPAYVQSNVSAESFGAGIGRGIRGLGNTIGQIAVQEREMAAAYAAADMELQFSRELAKGWNEFQNLKGLDPFDKAPTFQDSFAEKQKEYAGKLKDPLARNRFDIKSRTQMQQVAANMEEHAAAKRREYNAEITKGKVGMAVANAADVTLLPERDLQNTKVQMFMAEDSIRLQLMEAGHINTDGKEDAFAQLAVREFRSSVAQAMLQGYLHKAPEKGLAILEQQVPGTDYKISQIIGTDVEKWKEKFSDSSATNTAVNYSLDLVNRFGAFSDKAQAELDTKFKEGAVDQRTYSRTLEQYEARSQQRKRNQSFQEAGNWDVASKTFEDTRHDFAAVKASPIWRELTGDQQHRLENYAREYQAMLMGLPPTRDQYIAYINAMKSLAESPTAIESLDGKEVSDKFQSAMGPQLFPQFISAFNRSVATKDKSDRLDPLQQRFFDSFAFANMDIKNKKLHDLSLLKLADQTKFDAYTMTYLKSLEFVKEYSAQHKGEPVPSDVFEGFVKETWRKGYSPREGILSPLNWIGIRGEEISEPVAQIQGRDFTPAERQAASVSNKGIEARGSQTSPIAVKSPQDLKLLPAGTWYLRPGESTPRQKQ